MAGRIKIIRDTVVYKGWSTLRQYIISYTRRDGSKEKQTREIYDSGDGAAVLMYDPSNRKIILIRQFRLAALLNGHPTGFIIECPAGMLDQMHPEATIIKEIKEETGYEVTQVEKIYEAFATPGAHKEKIHFYTTAYDPSMLVASGGGDISEQEDIEVLEYNYDDIPGLLDDGSIMDAKTIILLLWAWKKLL
ncbi:MAG: NUDIX domain-containing protein [Saprospiraceae bacterium]|jgi:nudix-type nucleoside diphosphatase (YffH/AdpP family)|nr:NUDIX domain-containing protein [Saprospiraceae bacterium]